MAPYNKNSKKPVSSSKSRQAHNNEPRPSAPLVYDETAHREFVTGFRKRKLARRKHALDRAAETAKAERRQFRLEKRNYFRHTRRRMLGLDSSDEEGLDGGAAGKDGGNHGDTLVDKFERGDGAVVTTVVAPLDAPFGQALHALRRDDVADDNVNDAKGDKNKDVDISASDDDASDSEDGAEEKTGQGDIAAEDPKPHSDNNSAASHMESAPPEPPRMPVSKPPLRKRRSRRRHVSYTHAHHKRNNNKSSRTTHSQRRKRQARINRPAASF